MSDKMNKKQDGAIRLFGALSGVDEVYLAACEEDKGTSTKGVLVFWHKYGKGMAAVLCLAVLGAGYLSLSTHFHLHSNMGTDKAASVQEVPMNQAAASEECAEAAMPEADLENELHYEDGAIEEMAGNSDLSGGFGADAVEKHAESAKPESDLKVSTSNAEDLRDDKDGMDEMEQTLKEMSLDEAKALAVVGAYIPKNWPAGGDITAVDGLEMPGAEMVEILYGYNQEENSFAVRVMNLGAELPDWVQEEMEQGAIFRTEDFGRNCVEARIETPSESGNVTDTVRGRFGVLYETDANYVLVYFSGVSTVAEMWELMK